MSEVDRRGTALRYGVFGGLTVAVLTGLAA